MSDRILVSTRKGLFFFTRGKGGWGIDRTAFMGSPVTLTHTDTRDGAIYAALNLGHFGPKLHRSDDGGATWTELPVPAFAKVEEGEKGPSVVQIWGFAQAGARLWAGTVSGGLFSSDDRGESWQLNEGLWNVPGRAEWGGGGYDDPGIHSICVDPRDPKVLSVAISTGGIWRTTDNGANWSLRAKGLFAAYMPPELAEDEASQDVHMMVQCAASPDYYWLQHHNGIWRSTNDAARWDEVKPANASQFGFAVAVHPKDPETAWFVPAVKDEFRYPVDGKFVLSRTRDGGKSFDILSNGLPEIPSYDLVYRHGLDIDGTGTRLAVGSTTGGAWVTEDGGDSWTALPCRLPPVNAMRFG